MKLIVGLGNPGIEYNKTRHNIGFMILDNYLGEVKYKSNFQSLIFDKEVFNNKVIFLKPQTFMNLSGRAVIEIVDYYNIKVDDILIIQDDLDLEVGSHKLKRNSSSGGHNGIKSIIESLNTDSFLRLKIGIGKDKNIPTDKYVLGKLSNSDKDIIDNNLDLYNQIIDSFIKDGIEKTISLYNK